MNKDNRNYKDDIDYLQDYFKEEKPIDYYNGKEIYKAIENINNLSSNLHEELSNEFINAVPSMVLDGNKMHHKIGMDVSKAIEQVSKCFDGVFESLKKYTEECVQGKQSQERPQDFKKILQYQ